jgi:hypothetical protein
MNEENMRKRLKRKVVIPLLNSWDRRIKNIALVTWLTFTDDLFLYFIF